MGGVHKAKSTSNLSSLESAPVELRRLKSQNDAKKRKSQRPHSVDSKGFDNKAHKSKKWAKSMDHLNSVEEGKRKSNPIKVLQKAFFPKGSNSLGKKVSFSYLFQNFTSNVGR